MEHTALYVALGLQEKDPGYKAVLPVIESLGQSVYLGTALWYLHSSQSMQESFRRINTSMMDRRIDSSAGLLVLDPTSRFAKWHLRQPLSDLIEAHWSYQNNLFISFSLLNPSRNQQHVLERITKLGTWAPISKTTWYISSSVSSKDAFYFMLGGLESGDKLCVFDSAGNQAIWQEGQGLPGGQK